MLSDFHDSKTLLKGQGVSLSGACRVHRARHYILYIKLPTAAALRRGSLLKSSHRSRFTALNIVTGASLVPFIVQLLRSLMMGYVIVGLRLSSLTPGDAERGQCV